MHKRLLSIAAISGAISVALGAFGAHSLKEMVDADSVSTFDTGVRYQIYHTFAILIAAILHQAFTPRYMRISAYLFLAGIVLFSGSLYLLTILKATETVGLRGIGIITPIGGLFFIAGWITMFLGINSMPRKTID